MAIDIEEAKRNDIVGIDFEANYVSGVKKEEYDTAKEIMANLLDRYNGKDELMKHDYDYQRYRKASYLVYSYSKDQMEKSFADSKTRKERRNLLNKFFDDHQHLLFDVPEFALQAIKVYNEMLLLRGLENLEALYRRADSPKEAFNNLGNELYNVLGYMKNPPPCVILAVRKCSRDWEFLGDTQYVS